MAQPTHYLVGLEESRIRIGRFGFAREKTKNVAIVDIGRAKSIADAKTKAVAKYGKKNGVNPILLHVIDARVATPEPKVAPTTNLSQLAQSIGKGNVATMGIFTVKVRGA